MLHFNFLAKGLPSPGNVVTPEKPQMPNLESPGREKEQAKCVSRNPAAAANQAINQDNTPPAEESKIDKRVL